MKVLREIEMKGMKVTSTKGLSAYDGARAALLQLVRTKVSSALAIVPIGGAAQAVVITQSLGNQKEHCWKMGKPKQ